MELALQVTDISLFADVGSSEDGSKDEMEAVRGVGSVANEDSCNTSLSKRKRIKETEKNDSLDSTGNVSTLWSQLNQDDICTTSEASRYPKTMEEAAGVHPQTSKNRQNIGSNNPSKVPLINY